MRRAPIVVGATMAGPAAVVGFHTKSAPLTLGTLPTVAVPADPSTSAVMSGPTRAAPATTNPPTTVASTTAAPATTNPPTTVASTTPAPATTNPPTTVLPPTKTATGAAVNYGYGVLSVSATVSGTKLTNVAIASINDGGSFR